MPRMREAERRATDRQPTEMQFDKRFEVPGKAYWSPPFRYIRRAAWYLSGILSRIDLGETGKDSNGS